MLISVRDNEYNNRWMTNAKAKKNKNKKRQKRAKGDKSYSERVKAKWFYCTIKLGFLHLICKASLIFKSNLELALSITLKQWELYESKACCSGV